MKQIKLTTLILALLFLSCNQADTKTASTTEDNASNSINDREQIQTLIRQILIWADSKSSVELLPILPDSNDSLYIGFDLDMHQKNLDKLRQTNFFATEFIDNYNQIIQTLDNGIKSGKYEQWFVGDMPTFNFLNGVNPWCMCQDNLDWNTVEVKVIFLNREKGELSWYWGNLSADTDSSWKEFEYKFKVIKENDKWKIAYLQGFDFNESTR